MNEHLVEKRVEIPTHYDWWMRGARFGTVVRVMQNGNLRVKLDRTGTEITVQAEHMERYGKVLDS